MRIPERHQAGLQELLQLPDQVFAALLSALRDFPFKSLTQANLLAVVEKNVPDVKTSGVEKLVDALGSLYVVLGSTELSASELVPDVVEALAEDSTLEAEEVQRLSSRLREVLSLDRPALVAKASSLLSDYEHGLCRVKILTDMRPVFGESASDSPAAAVVAYTLKISYHSGPRIEDFYVAMDLQDLRTLKGLIGRAESKGKALEAILQKAGIPSVDVSSEDK